MERLLAESTVTDDPEADPKTDPKTDPTLKEGYKKKAIDYAKSVIAKEKTLDEEFDKRNVQVIGVSTDSQFSHWKWLQTEKNDGGIKGVKYPLVADQSKTISMDYDVLAGEYDFDDAGNFIYDGTPMAYRGLFLIDKKGVVQHQVVNNMPLGRSIKETLRMIDALQFFEENGEVCPADWHEGEEGLKATQEGIAKYLEKRN